MIVTYKESDLISDHVNLAPKAFLLFDMAERLVLQELHQPVVTVKTLVLIELGAIPCMAYVIMKRCLGLKEACEKTARSKNMQGVIKQLTNKQLAHPGKSYSNQNL